MSAVRRPLAPLPILAPCLLLLSGLCSAEPLWEAKDLNPVTFHYRIATEVGN